MIKIKELREKSEGELRKMLVEKRETARKIRFDIASRQVKNHREGRNAKKDIAKILTILKK
jgi:ribosomal protein L29